MKICMILLILKKTLKNSGVLIDGITETVKHKKNKKLNLLELC